MRGDGSSKRPRIRRKPGCSFDVYMYYNFLSLMYVLYKSKNILTLGTIGCIVGFIVGIYIEYCLWAQVAVLNHKLLY